MEIATLFLRKKGLNHSLKLVGGNFNGDLLELLREYEKELSKIPQHKVAQNICTECKSTNTQILRELEYDDGYDEPNTSNNLITVNYLLCNDCGEHILLKANY